MPPPLSSLQKFFGSPRVQKFYPVLFPLTLFFLILIAPVPRSASILASSSASSAAEIIPGAATEAAATSDSGVSALAVSEKTPPPTAHDPYNVYFLKIPKVGGTTLAVLLQRYAKQFQLQVASPLAATRSVASCQGRDGALKAWNELRARSPGGRFDIMMCVCRACRRTNQRPPQQVPRVLQALHDQAGGVMEQAPALAAAHHVP
jgi:hypothetical protein